ARERSLHPRLREFFMVSSKTSTIGRRLAGIGLACASRLKLLGTNGGLAMGLFSKILDKLGFNRSAAQAAPAPQAPLASQAAPAPKAAPVSATPAAPVAVSVVDVVAKLEGLAAAHAEKLNWKVSIVDLLKLLDLDSSFAARKELAAELGCPAQKMGDSAQMNMWLHKAVLQKLAENGGNVPKELLG